MKSKLNYTCWLLLLLVLGCSPIRVKRTDAAPGFRLSNYNTFGFYPPDNPELKAGDKYSPKLDYLKGALIVQLEQRGLQYSDSLPDLMLNLGMVVLEKVQTREADFMTDRPRYMGQQRYHWSSGEIEVGRYKEGTISVHLVDRERNEMVWQGEAEAIVPDKNRKVQKRINKGVQTLLKNVPQ